MLADTIRKDSTVCDPSIAGADTTAVSPTTVLILRRIFEPEKCAVSASATAKKISCHSKNDGQIELKIETGEPPFQISWSKNGQQLGSVSAGFLGQIVQIDSIGAGEVVVSIASANGSASTIGPFQFFDPPPNSLIINELDDFNGFAVRCPESKNGRAEVEAVGAIYPLDVYWSNGAITARNELLTAGWHSVSVTDASGCRTVDSFFMSAPEKMRAEIESRGEKCAGASDGFLRIEKVEGGAAPVAFRLDDGPTTSETFFDKLAPGLRLLFLTDANGCEDTVGAVLPAGLPFDFDFLTEIDSIFTGDTLVLEVDLPARADSFLLEPPIGLVFSTKNEAWLAPERSQFFKIVALDSAGCRAEDSFFLKVKKQREVFFPTAVSRSARLEENRYFRPFFSGGVAEIEIFQIFDRWGQLVFEKKNWLPEENFLGWDGSFRGQRTTGGVFVFRLKARMIDGSTKSYSGDFSFFD